MLLARRAGQRLLLWQRCDSGHSAYTSSDAHETQTPTVHTRMGPDTAKKPVEVLRADIAVQRCTTGGKAIASLAAGRRWHQCLHMPGRPRDDCIDGLHTHGPRHCPEASGGNPERHCSASLHDGRDSDCVSGSGATGTVVRGIGHVPTRRRQRWIAHAWTQTVPRSQWR